jgi:hypothetical protein
LKLDVPAEPGDPRRYLLRGFDRKRILAVGFNAKASKNALLQLR